MAVAVFPARELPDSLLSRWANIQQCNPALRSPFFRPEFTQAVARARDDVFVAVIDGGAAFFPFQRSSLGLGRPVGGPASDYHGLIAAGDYQCDLIALMKACKLRTWYFDHIPIEQAMFSPWCNGDAESSVIDLLADSPPGSTSLYADHRRKWRRLERECGRVDVELETMDQSVLDFCLKWKSAHFRRTGVPDLLGQPWARALVEFIASHCEPEFAGMLSVLRVDGQSIAAHFGLRSKTVWHYWFPTYNPQFQRYSPGMLLLLEMIAGAPKLGIEMIDLGIGDYSYKARLANRTIPLVEGCVATNKLTEFAVKAHDNAKVIYHNDPILRHSMKPFIYIYHMARFR